MMSMARVAARRGGAATLSGGRRASPTTTTRTLWSNLMGATDASTSTATAATATNTSGGGILTSLQQENPYLDVVQYQHKNRTWSVQHVDYYSTAVAIGLAEHGLVPGDVVVSWLPSHFSEQMVLQFACSKAGFILYTLDPAVATRDPVQAQTALAAALALTQANVLVSQEAGSDVNYIRLAEAVVPELRIFDTSSGMPFVTPRYPHLRLCLQTGFDQDDKWGWYPLRHFVVPSNNLDAYIHPSKLSADTPLAGSWTLSEGVPVSVGPTLTNAQVHTQKIWPTYSNILDGKFHVVEGVGVIF